MPQHPAIENLIRLMETDREIMAGERTITEQPKIVESRRVDLERAQKRLDDFVSEIKDLEAHCRLVEKSIKAHQEKIKDFERRLNEATSNAEYAGLKKSITTQEKKITEKEDELLAAYEKLDEMGEKREKLKAEVRREEEALEALAADVQEEVDILKEEVAELKEERAAIADEVSGKFLERYERILDRHGDAALAQVVDQVCQGCHVTIRPNVINLLMKGEDLITCKTCSRILYL